MEPLVRVVRCGALWSAPGERGNGELHRPTRRDSIDRRSARRTAALYQVPESPPVRSLPGSCRVGNPGQVAGSRVCGHPFCVHPAVRGGLESPARAVAHTTGTDCMRGGRRLCDPHGSGQFLAGRRPAVALPADATLYCLALLSILLLALRFERRFRYGPGERMARSESCLRNPVCRSTLRDNLVDVTP